MYDLVFFFLFLHFLNLFALFVFVCDDMVLICFHTISIWFPYDFDMILIWVWYDFDMIVYDFDKVFIWFGYNFHMISYAFDITLIWFGYDFDMIFPIFDIFLNIQNISKSANPDGKSANPDGKSANPDDKSANPDGKSANLEIQKLLGISEAARNSRSCALGAIGGFWGGEAPQLWVYM